MKLRRSAVYFSMGLVLTCLAACSGPQVSRVNASEEIDLSGYWNDVDSQQVAQEMINDSFANQWVIDYKKEKGRKPSVIIGSVVNKTEEHISTETFVKDLERNFLTSGKVTFVGSKDQRAEVRAERKDYAEHNSKVDSAKKSRSPETAADFMLKGQINSIVGANKKAQLKYYQVELELINLETNEKVWMGQKKIKKFISKKPYKA
ncbi:hypothetical protein AGMMS49593_03640 [Endomicrobiia bacterium]|nr:hypothetical protein AGMMS49593_03640 [Endomicrobiia bacterium]